MDNDEFCIKRCEFLGVEAAAKGNSPVGAIVVRDGKIVSEAEEANRSKNDVTCHAEIEAIRKAVGLLQTNDLSDCILYTTHEPCIMCAYAIRFYRIKKVVFKNRVPYLGGVTSSFPLLTAKEMMPPHWSAPPEIVHWSQ